MDMSVNGGSGEGRLSTSFFCFFYVAEYFASFIMKKHTFETKINKLETCP